MMVDDEMSSTNEKDVELGKAVENGNVDKVHELLDQGADPNYSEYEKPLIKLAMEKNYIDIIILLIQYGAIIEPEDNLDEYIFQSAYSRRTKELIALIFEQSKDNDLLEDFLFLLLFFNNHDGPPGLEIFRLLLDLGLSIHEFVGAERSPEDDFYTALHHAAMDNRVDFIQELLARGADIHKKTGLGFNCISVSLLSGARDPMIKLLVEKGVQINEKFDEGKTCLHRACEIEFLASTRAIHTLCKYGADVNILDDYGYTPIMCVNSYVQHYKEIQEAMIEELAKLKFEGQFLCPENLNYIEAYDSEEDDDCPISATQKIFDNCLEELQRMKSQKFYKNVTLYDIVGMSKYQKKKLIFWTKNKDFVNAFESGWDRKLFKHYAKYVEDLFKDVMEVRDLLKTEEEQLYSVFKKYLPDLVTRKIAYFKHEQLLF